MPTYEYECLKCKYRFEEFQSMTDEPLKVCPRCGGELRRLIGTGSAVIFKGKGFYHTDYKTVSTQHKEKKVQKKVNPKARTKKSKRISKLF